MKKPAVSRHIRAGRGGGAAAAGRLLLAVWLVACVAAPAAAQPGSNWEPEAFADYLLSGQTPHPAVVRIVAAENGGASLGSGVLVDANREQGLVLTNWHVVRDSRSAVLVQFPDGFQTAGTVVRQDETWDLAALVIWRPPATPVPLAAVPPAPGDPLTIAGYGRGPYRAQTGRCTEYLSPGTGHPKEFVELAAGARQGDSGGPILNERGELAGVLFGQNSGRTIGSCSTRLRTFLAGVGSSGFTPAAAAAYAAARAIEAGPRATEQRANELGVNEREATEPGATGQPPRIRMAAAAIDRPTMQAPPIAVSSGQGFGPPPGQLPQAGDQYVWDASHDGWHTVDHLPTIEQLVAVCDVNTNGRVMLSAVGGAALAVLGLRTLFGGRRRAAAPRETFDDD